MVSFLSIPCASLYSVQWLAGALKDLGYGAVSDSIDNETLLVKAIFAEEQFGATLIFPTGRVNLVGLDSWVSYWIAKVLKHCLYFELNS